MNSLENMSNEEVQLIIPKKAIFEIQKLFLDNAKISYDNTNLVISNENTTFFTKLINGKYPDYERIVPSNLKNNLYIPKNIFIESIKLITSLNSNIKITFTKQAIIFESLDTDSVANTQVDIDLTISTINFINSIKKISPAIDNNNPKFELNGALLDIKSQKINFCATDTRKPEQSNSKRGTKNAHRKNNRRFNKPNRDKKGAIGNQRKRSNRKTRYYERTTRTRKNQNEYRKGPTYGRNSAGTNGSSLKNDKTKKLNAMYSRGYSVGVEDSSVNRRLRHLRG